MEFESFHDAYLDGAGELLAARHCEHRAMRPELPAQFGEPRNARVAVAALLQREGTSGLAAVESGRMVGYLLGTARHDVLRRRHVWVELAGHAAVPDRLEVLRDLYAYLAEGWIQEGYFARFVMTPVLDPAVALWFSLCFGREQVHAIRPVSDGIEEVPNVEVRWATPDDVDAILEIGDGIARHLAASPVFGVYLPERAGRSRDDYVELLSDEAARTWVVEEDRRIIALQPYEPVPPSGADPLTPDNCVALSVSITRRDRWGKGYARALAAWGLRDAWERGYRYCATDWRSANFPSARVWPRLGFEPTVYRLYRRIEDRILWARGPARDRT